jgi:hypothetical protein
MSFFFHRDFYPYVDYYLTHKDHTEMDNLLKSKCLYLTENPKDVVKKLSNANVLFINPDKFNEWTDILLFIHEKNPLPVKLMIIADSDLSLSNENMDILFAFFDKTEFWIQNWEGYHERCTLLPIGVSNIVPSLSQEKYSSLAISYTKLYIGCQAREDFFAFLNKYPEIQRNCLPKTTFADYMARLAKCKIHTCPMGEGYDTFRFWETLAVGTVPIVKDHFFYECLLRQYPDLPMIRLSEWDMLIEYNEEIPSIPHLPFLYTEYWVSKIKELLK